MLCAVRPAAHASRSDENERGTAINCILHSGWQPSMSGVQRIRRCRWCSMMRSSPG